MAVGPKTRIYQVPRLRDNVQTAEAKPEQQSAQESTSCSKNSKTPGESSGHWAVLAKADQGAVPTMRPSIGYWGSLYPGVEA
jgi:hypothetical protein